MDKEHQETKTITRKYIADGWTWFLVIWGLAMSINAATVDFSAKAIILNHWLGPVIGRAIYFLFGVIVVVAGVTRFAGLWGKAK